MIVSILLYFNNINYFFIIRSYVFFEKIYYLSIITHKNEQKLILNISTITNNSYGDATINTNGILLYIYILI
ncbi:hypothetical protein PFTANZ_00427 [Plasmodium falciparum Tanzania (2000708)]|uniref:Uncharacterized protein n=1 Tax=Plasmodium falciparum Tanzania (2000708) TaxID=1036725 RepID=A0A024WDP1_PLAFA|nr:hypothetical protein PFTANZ_00427 [Plasmodium falciparum Tanzania (2000708)]